MTSEICPNVATLLINLHNRVCLGGVKRRKLNGEEFLVCER